MKIRKTSSRAFTLIELLVVITIIAILAGIALPVYNNVTERGQQTKALSNAKQIGLACKLFAGDNDGNYPQNYEVQQQQLIPIFGVDNKPPDANRAFRLLVPDYVASENIFYLAKSAWTPTAPDENIDSEANILKAGENHWAYVPLLNDTSNPNFPLIADGFTSESVGTYSNKQTEKGGVWSGKKAIVIRTDQSGTIETVDRNSLQVLGRTGGQQKEDIFDPNSNSQNWIPEEPVNPL